MVKRVPIKINVANALQWLGTLYRNPADAIKEHISNAIDEHLKAQQRGEARETCEVAFILEKKNITIEYSYGMDRKEFEQALQRVADSAKRSIDVAQIGQLGIGIFSFQQIGRKCTFFSKKKVGEETTRVVLREGADKAEFESALKRESLSEPGIKIIISELKFDPTRARGPIAPERLKRVFAEKFDGHLQKGWLKIKIVRGSRTYLTEPLKIDLPKIARGLSKLSLPRDQTKQVALSLYYDPSGKGKVAIRHQGVAIIEDIKQTSAYGLEESVYAGGNVKGFIDADFLNPLPARTGFEENQDWISFLDLLDKQRPQIEAEVEELKKNEKTKALSEIAKKAISMAREILDLDEFQDLEFPGRMVKPRQPAQTHRKVPTGQRTGERSKEPGKREDLAGFRINYEETPFEDTMARHSRFVGGVIQANTLNPDYTQEMEGPEEAKLAYATLMIGKEIIAYNDKSGAADDFLEKLIGFHFKLKRRLA